MRGWLAPPVLFPLFSHPVDRRLRNPAGGDM